MASSGRQQSASQALNSQALKNSLIGLLCCPACKGPLSIEEVPARHLISCVRCGRRYPVVDGLPVLIPDRAIAVPDPSPTGDPASH